MTSTARTVGYARVSTDEQNLDLQLQALKAIGCDDVFTDQISGASHFRPGLNEAINRLREGDKLVVWRLDRLGRSLLHLVQILHMLGERKIKFCSISEHIDTTSSGGRLVFHMMAALAEFERNLISERTRAGMAAARSRGQKIGRRTSLNREQCNEAAARLAKGERASSIAATFGVTPRTLHRLLKAQQASCPPVAKRQLFSFPADQLAELPLQTGLASRPPS